MKFLSAIFEKDKFPIVKVRSTSSLIIIYDLVDALGSSFGSTLLIKGNIEYIIYT